MNTTKTLEEILKEAREQFDEHEYAESLLLQTWNAALDACRDKMPDRDEASALKDSDEIFHIRMGFNGYREKALKAIDSLRTVGGKEYVGWIPSKEELEAGTPGCGGGKENFSCGRCDWLELGSPGEEIPKHFRTCPKREHATDNT